MPAQRLIDHGQKTAIAVYSGRLSVQTSYRSRRVGRSWRKAASPVTDQKT